MAESELGKPSEKLICIVDDDDSVRELLEFLVKKEGFRCETAADGEEGLNKIKKLLPDLVVLDLMLPGMDGLEVCKQIQRDGWTPVLMLTARTEEADKVAGFAVGADDYLTKPFSLRELTVRVKAILRRVDRIKGAAEPVGAIERNGMMIDAARRRVEVDGAEIGLTPLEFEILLTLARDPGVVLSRDALMDGVWGYRDYAGGRVVDSHVARIRRKLGEDGNEPRFIRTVHGVGYAFKE